MKKLLALVLALVMTLGLATVGTNAAYSDEKDINYDEAVTVLSTIGILKGDESGFRPGETLKRSEGAKIIAYLMLGNETAEAMVGTGTKFTDVPASHWAAGYIEYLTTQKVISGVGGGKFDPDGQLTTNQFAKMLLVALGFDANIEGLTGSDWAINTQKLANLASVDLFDGNDDAKGNEAIKREEAALYAFNVLQTPLVTYDSKGTEIAVNGAEIKFAASNWKYDTAQAGKNSNATNIKNDTINETGQNPADLIEFAEKYYTHLTLVDNGDSCDDLGRPVRKWNWYNAEIGTFTKSNELVKTWTAKVTAKMVYDELGKAVSDTLHNAKFNALGEVTDGAGLRVYMDGMNFARGVYSATNLTTAKYASDADDEFVGANAAGVGAVASAAIDPYVHKSNTTKISDTGNGSVTEMYMDSDKNVTLVTYHTYLYQAAGDYSSTNKTLNLVQVDDTKAVALKNYKLKVDDFPEVENWKDDDYILVTAAKTGATYEVQSVAKAEIVSGKVTTFDTTDNQSVTLDGTLYKYARTADDPMKNTKFSVGQTAKLVLDKYGYVVAVDEALETSDYVFVLEWGSSSNLAGDARATVVFADGTDGEINVKQAADYDNVEGKGAGADCTSKSKIAGWANTTAVKNYGAGRNELRWYTFSKNSSNEYSLYKIESKYTQGTLTYGHAATAVAIPMVNVAENNKAKFLVAAPAGLTNTNPGLSNLLLADDKTVAITLDNDEEYESYTGVKNMPEIQLGAAAADGLDANTVSVYAVYKAVGGYTALVFFLANGAKTNVSGGDGENLVYVIKFSSETRSTDGKVWFNYKVLDESTGEEVSVQADKRIDDPKTNIYSAAFYTHKNSDGQLTGFTEVDTADLPDGAGVVAASNQKGSVYGEKNLTRRLAAIDYSGSTITIGGQTFTVNNNTKTTLITRKAAGVMNNDAAADYELFTATGSAGPRQIDGLLENYNYIYDYAVKCTSKDSMIAEQIVVTIQVAAQGAAVNSTAMVQYMLDEAGVFNGNFTLPAGDTLTLSKNSTMTGTVTINGHVDLNGHTLTINGNLYNNANNTIDATDNLSKLVVNGDFENNGSLLMNGGSTLEVNGDMTIKGGTTVQLAGTVTVIGDLDIQSTASGVKIDTNVAVTGTTTVAAKTLDKTSTGAIQDANGNDVISTATIQAGTYTVAADTSIIAITIV